MKAEHLTHPNLQDIADVLNLFREIPGRTCTAANFLQYLNQYWMDLALIVVRDTEGRVGGFTLAVKPGLLDPRTGRLPFSSCRLGHQASRAGFELAKSWLREQGASRIRMTSVRHPKSLQRGFGFYLCEERLFETEIQP